MTLHDTELTQIKYTFELKSENTIESYELYIYENDFYTVTVTKRIDDIKYTQFAVTQKEESINYLPKIFVNRDLFDDDKITLEIQTAGIGSLSSDKFAEFIKASEIGLKCMNEIEKMIAEISAEKTSETVAVTEVEEVKPEEMEVVETKTTEKMNRLMASLEKSEAKVEKIKGTIERHFKQLDKKIAVVTELGYTVTYDHLEFGIFSSKFEASYRDMEQQKWSENRKDGDYWALCEVFSKLDDINSSYRKLAEAEKIVSNWKEKINKEMVNVTVNNTAPQVIIDFVDAWGEMAYEWYMRNSKNPNAEALRKLINDEKVYKVRDLIYRVEAVTGKITDADYLSVGEKGDLTGFIIGENGRAWIETISAGGWNIQCFHYRTIVYRNSK